MPKFPVMELIKFNSLLEHFYVDSGLYYVNHRNYWQCHRSNPYFQVEDSNTIVIVSLSATKPTALPRL